MNPYLNELDETFRGHYVRVAKGDTEYEGYARVFNYNDREVIIHGASRDGEHVGSVVVAEFDTIEQRSAPRLADVPVDAIQNSPYASRTYGDDDLDSYVRNLRQRGALYSFPTARTLGENQYELLGGHKRTEAATRAGFETIPVRIVDVDDWGALVAFVDEHIPMDQNELNDGSDSNRGWYTEEEIKASLDKMRRDWDDSELQSIPAVSYWLSSEALIDDSVPRLEPTSPSESERLRLPRVRRGHHPSTPPSSQMR